MKGLEVIKDYRSKRKRFLDYTQNSTSLQEQSLASRARFMKHHNALSTLELPIEAIVINEIKQASTKKPFDRKKWNAKGWRRSIRKKVRSLRIRLKDLRDDYPCQFILKWNAQRTCKNTTKKVDHCRFIELFDSVRGGRSALKDAPKSDSVVEGTDIYTLNLLMDYFEQRCLDRPQSKEPLFDLVALILVFNVPQSNKHLKGITLGDVDSNTNTIFCAGEHYPISKYLVDLCQALFSRGDLIMMRDTKQINQLINQTAKTLGLKNKISPIKIRHSLEQILKEHFC